MAEEFHLNADPLMMPVYLSIEEAIDSVAAIDEALLNDGVTARSENIGDKLFRLNR